MKAGDYYRSVITKAILKGLIKPWNWPGFLLGIVFPPLLIGWLVFSAIYYNRLGLFNYKTDAWETIWPEVAGYYNYLSKVEAERRSYELQHHKEFYTVSRHDPYLVAALLQKEWERVFSIGREVGAGGKEYNTP